MDRTDQKIILYGCGLIGAEALQTFGSDLVMCFCDSRKELAGTEKYGKEVISADELKSVPSDKIHKSDNHKCLSVQEILQSPMQCLNWC